MLRSILAILVGYTAVASLTVTTDWLLHLFFSDYNHTIQQISQGSTLWTMALVKAIYVAIGTYLMAWIIRAQLMKHGLCLIALSIGSQLTYTLSVGHLPWLGLFIDLVLCVVLSTWAIQCWQDLYGLNKGKHSTTTSIKKPQAINQDK